MLVSCSKDGFVVNFGTELAIDNIAALSLLWPNSGDHEFYLGPTAVEEGEAKQKTENLVHRSPAHSPVLCLWHPSPWTEV